MPAVLVTRPTVTQARRLEAPKGDELLRNGPFLASGGRSDSQY